MKKMNSQVKLLEKKLFNRIFLLIVADVTATFLSLYIGIILRFNSFDLNGYSEKIVFTAVLFSVIIIVIYTVTGLYKSLWKYASIEELVKLIISSLLAVVAVFLINLIWENRLPNSVFAIAFLVQTGISGGIRFSYRVMRAFKSDFILKSYKNDNVDRIIVIGSGYEASATIKNYSQKENNGVIVALVDRYNKKGSIIHNVKIEGTLEEIEHVIQRFKANEVIIASENFSEEDIAFVLDVCARTKCKLKKYTAINEVGSRNLIVDIDPKDLLGRPQVNLNQDEVNAFVHGKTVLVTGGGGSIGSELIKQMAEFEPAHIIILDINENDAYLTKLVVEKSHPGIKVEVIIGSVRDRIRICQVCDKYRPDIIFHAAAHKHVPLMEKSPNEALKNNIIGTYNVAYCADKFNIKKFVLISTDKAVNPTNIMGATKRIAEIIISAFDQTSETEFSAVRFGNVLGSSGSVIPIFRQQIESGGPVRVTHPDVRRFFMTIQEACQLVLQAGAIAKGGEVFILDMGKAVKIKELASNLIKMYGYIPEVDIKIEYIGLRPGEKLYEEIMLDAEAAKTKHEKIFVAKAKITTLDEVNKYLEDIQKSIDENYELNKVIELLQQVVPEFIPLDIQEINGNMNI
ncbi:MAG: polysaccharide biosynthesis protein [Clostridia bacterium]|nr:polysaccharide biosynthesis protein [Clostridia bacterium]